MYQAKSLVNKFFLRKKLYSLRIEEGGSITDHLNTVNLLIAQLASSGAKIEEEDHCMTLLCSFLDLWDHLLMALGSTIVTFHMDDLVYFLLYEDMQRKTSDSSKEALVVHRRSNDRGKQNDNKSKKGISKSRGSYKTLEKYKAKCWNCDKSGHF